MRGTCTAHANRIQVEFVGCSSSSNMEPWHTAWAISPNTAQIDIQYLRLLVEHRVQEIKKQCTYIGYLTSKRNYYSKYSILKNLLAYT